MSPVRPNGGESLQEMIDRYNRELMKMGRTDHPEVSPQPTPKSAPPFPGRRPEAEEQLHRPGSGMPRPFPDEPLDESALPTDFVPGMGAREQGLRDLRQGQLDREQGLRDMEQARREREQGLEEIRKGRAELEKGLKELETGLMALEQMRREMAERQEWSSRVLPAAARPGESAGYPVPTPNHPVPVEPTIPGRVPAQTAMPYEDGYGTLIVQVYTARRAEPVAGARVAVTQNGQEGETLRKVMTTDEDGRTPPLRLPVAAGTGVGADRASPYADYIAYVSADGYQPSGALVAQMFAGVTSLLPVELIPGEQVMN